MKFFAILFAFIILLGFPSIVFASDCIPPEGGKCLTADQFNAVKASLIELDQIHKSPAVITTTDKIVIIRDWDGRVYVDGGAKKPIKFELKLGNTVDREMAITLDTQVSYRIKPPDPMFRLRFRAQAGVLIPQLLKVNSGWNKYDAQLSFDFFHVGNVNFNVAAGVRSFGVGPGLDLTKNFGVSTNFAILYDGFKPGALVAIYFSF